MICICVKSTNDFASVSLGELVDGGFISLANLYFAMSDIVFKSSFLFVVLADALLVRAIFLSLMVCDL